MLCSYHKLFHKFSWNVSQVLPLLLVGLHSFTNKLSLLVNCNFVTNKTVSLLTKKQIRSLLTKRIHIGLIVTNTDPRIIVVYLLWRTHLALRHNCGITFGFHYVLDCFTIIFIFKIRILGSFLFLLVRFALNKCRRDPSG